MNYLGHAYLSMGNTEILCGNMMGDFVKGLENLNHYPEGIRKGLLLHRHIDTFTDRHPAIIQAKQIFRPVYGLYSGALVDTVMDYFIANDPALFADQPALDRFSLNVYRQLAIHTAHFPPKFIPYYNSMIQHNWLSHYRTEDGLKSALRGLMRRAKNIAEIETVSALLKENEAELKSCYSMFIEDVIYFVKIELQGD